MSFDRANIGARPDRSSGSVSVEVCVGTEQSYPRRSRPGHGLAVTQLLPPGRRPFRPIDKHEIVSVSAGAYVGVHPRG